MPPRSATPRIAIIGSGFSGLCLAIELKKAGIESFTILEKAGRIGGTWRDNDYPGAACDAASFLYCFSFEQKTDWSRKWAGQAEILAYMEACSEKWDLGRHLRFHAEAASARFDATEGTWQIRMSDGSDLHAEVLVSGVGQLHRPFTPEIPGLEQFTGERFHSARWNHAAELAGKRVAVIGNAASAIQFIPRIAPEVAQLFVFQRSANWLLPKRDRQYREGTQRLFTRHPRLARLYRWWIWFLLELTLPVFHRNRFLGRRMERFAQAYLRSRVSDPELRAALVPDYPIGGKRILISDDYYDALTRENVELVTAGIERLTEAAVVTLDGVERPVDVVISATGFESTAFLAPMHIEGLAGKSLADEWKDGARAFLGITVADFPNLFLMYGPNTNLGHNSIIFMIECQAHYIVECIRKLRDGGIKYLDLKPEVQAAFDRRVQKRLRGSTWAQTGKSWYKTEDGRITNNWPGSTVRYWWETRRPKLRHYRREPA